MKNRQKGIKLERNVVLGIMLTLLLMGVLTSVSNFHLVKATPGTITIMADGTVYPPTAPISSADNVTYTFTDNIYDEISVRRSNIIVDGDGFTLQGSGDGDGFCLFSFLSVSVHNVTIKNTIVKNFEYGFYVRNSTLNTIAGNTITENQKDGINLYKGGNYTTISGNTIIKNNGDGVDIYKSYFNTVSGNEIKENNGDGVDIYKSYFNTVSENTVTTNGGDGVSTWESSSDTISGNIITDNTYLGVPLILCDHCIVSDNTITDCKKGIYASGSTDNSISGNTVTANTWQGIVLTTSSDHNIVCENTIENNNDVGLGIYTSYNTIYHNHILNNTRQAYDSGTSNVWDDGWPSGGNYWSDYYGTDYYLGPLQDGTGSDGIGDTPHIFDDKRDRYPLLLPGHKITTESNTTITNVVATTSALLFETSGPEGTIGYINVILPVDLNKTAIKVYVNDVEITPPPFPIITTNGTHYFIYFEFAQSTHHITIQYAPFDFSVSASPASRTVTQGGSTTYTVTVTLTSGTTENIFLSCSGCPTDATCTFSPSSDNPTFPSTLTVSTSTSTPANTYTLTITGTGGGKTHSDTVTLTVTKPQDVGGVMIPIDKLGLVAPYIFSTSIIVVTATVATIYAKRKLKHRKTKKTGSENF